ncbi:HD domain-containing protein [Mogibacterium pumilum]|uniref:HD domain-containing protein n=1 Tax=Mogibacterium pumilum TaxID=86332 RepID=A0A223AS13_9FIRM|nr:HD domain-containing protein [Mogibacterium pumilum]ASS37719.1 hypothetical protein AXF17_04130 [Mogibacterium pumilum]
MQIDKEKQQELFAKYNTPEHVQRHCNEVARVSVLIAESLIAKGFQINVKELRGAALVHDVLRTEKDHDKLGAEVLMDMKLPHEADLVRRHMIYHPFNCAEKFQEIDILCLADRLVKEDCYVGLDERMQYLIDKPGKTQERTARILKAKAHTQEIIYELEEVLGVTLDELCRKV